MWKRNNMDVRMIDFSDQFTHREVYNTQGKITNWLKVIYAHNQLHNRKNLWKDIKNCATGAQEPWIVIRDFNNVLKVEDRIRGNNV